jgi:hypothetical protein
MITQIVVVMPSMKQMNCEHYSSVFSFLCTKQKLLFGKISTIRRGRKGELYERNTCIWPSVIAGEIL